MLTFQRKHRHEARHPLPCVVGRQISLQGRPRAAPDPVHPIVEPEHQESDSSTVPQAAQALDSSMPRVPVVVGDRQAEQSSGMRLLGNVGHICGTELVPAVHELAVAQA